MIALTRASAPTGSRTSCKLTPVQTHTGKSLPSRRPIMATEVTLLSTGAFAALMAWIHEAAAGKKRPGRDST
jgi:hypothetical protein